MANQLVKSALLGTFLSLTFVGVSNADVIANLLGDYDGNNQNTSNGFGRWNYLWNAPVDWSAGALSGTGVGDVTTGSLSDPTGFRLLVNEGSFWTADGNLIGTDSNPDRFIRIGGPAPAGILIHPGAQAGFNVGGTLNAFDRYAIAAFTVNDAAIYSISEGTAFTNATTSNGIDVWAFATGQTPVLLGSSTGGGPAFSFSHSIGTVQSGDTIYVAFGTNGNPSTDGTRANFSIEATAVPEPNCFGLVASGGLLVGFYRRRSKATNIAPK